VNKNCFYTSTFMTSCFVFFAMDGIIEQRVCIKFCVKLSKCATETLEILCEAFGEHSLSRTAVFWMAFTFQGRSSVSWRRRTYRAIKHHQNDRICWKIRELIHEDLRRTIHGLANTVGISYGVWQEILTEKLNTRRIAPSSRQRARPHVRENHRFCD
jgi:hypothetical protein